jgi:hypothetical protein
VPKIEKIIIRIRLKKVEAFIQPFFIFGRLNFVRLDTRTKQIARHSVGTITCQCKLGACEVPYLRYSIEL